MLTRSPYQDSWFFQQNIANAATISIPVGNDLSGFEPADAASEFLMPVATLPLFSIDVFTDRAVTVAIQTGHTTTTLATMATLTCGAVLQHNTVYNLPAPFNRDGFLVLTAPYCRLQVNNATGADTTTFQLFARVWR